MHLFVRHNRRLLGIGIPLALAVLATATATDGSATAPLAAATTPANGVRVRVDLSERRLVLEDGGQVVREFGVAIGKPSHPTPTGQFTVRKMIWNPRWVPPKNRAWARGKKPREPGDPGNPMQTVKIFFKEPYYYIHGTNDPKSIGAAASHGCLRMTPEDAAELGGYLMEHGGQPEGESWFRRVLRFGRSTVVYLRNPIQMTISA
jgi:lipoprotein-anchoring transpeptidase ErfK/SrfK